MRCAICKTERAGLRSGWCLSCGDSFIGRPDVYGATRDLTKEQRIAISRVMAGRPGLGGWMFWQIADQPSATTPSSVPAA